MKQLKNATEQDILELKKRLKERRERKILDRDLQEVINLVNNHHAKCERRAI